MRRGTCKLHWLGIFSTDWSVPIRKITLFRLCPGSQHGRLNSIVRVINYFIQSLVTSTTSWIFLFFFYIPNVVILCISFYVTLWGSSFQMHRFIVIFHSTGTIFNYLANWIASMYTFKDLRKYDTTLCQMLIIELGIISKTRLLFYFYVYFNQQLILVIGRYLLKSDPINNVLYSTH